MWEDAKARFEKITSKNPTPTKPQSLEDVLTELDNYFNPSDTGDDSRMRRVKETAVNVLQLINLLGGVAAQGASMVFGPANMCFNAMQFLINIPARISKFYDDLGRLFYEISTFMKQFKIYQRIEKVATLDFELKEGTHKLLIIFVDICAISIDVLSGSKMRRLKTFAGIALFGNDSGIPAKLEEFKTLIQHQSQISDAITLEHVLKSEHDNTSSIKNMAQLLKSASEDSRRQLLDRLKDTHDDVLIVKSNTRTLIRDVDKRSSEEKSRKQFEEVCKKLSISTSDLLVIETDYDKYQGKIADGTGSWLAEKEVYQQWAKAEDGKNLQLLLSGAHGSGKTSLAFSILNLIKTGGRSDLSGSDPVAVAFHVFSKLRKAREAVKDSLKSIAAQLFKTNVVHSRNLYKYLQDKTASSLNDMSIEDMWTDMIVNPNAGDNPTPGSVLLFDGIDQLNDKEASLLLDAVFVNNSPKVQIIFTGTERKFQTCLRPSEIDLDSYRKLRVEEHNEPDIKKFINSKLHQDFEALHGDSATISRIRDQIHRKLPGVANGNLDNAEQIMRKVCSAVEEDMDEDGILHLISGDVLEHSDVALKKSLDELNSSLTNREIEQLNEILIWTIYAFEPITIDQTRAALLWCFQRLPIQELGDRISQKYSDLLRIEEKDGETYIYPKTNDIDVYMRNLERRKRKDQLGDDDPRISMTIEIKDANRSQVRKFFWDLSGKVVLENFGFTSAAITSSKAVTVGANDVDSHLTITKTCFELLLDDEKREEIQVLAEYAIFWLPSHIEFLRDCADRGLLEDSDKVAIIGNLVDLLQSVEYVDRHLTP